VPEEHLATHGQTAALLLLTAQKMCETFSINLDHCKNPARGGKHAFGLMVNLNPSIMPCWDMQ
jgi:hypothetical protein